MKLFALGVVLLLTLQGCSSLGESRHIKSCNDYPYGSSTKKNMKQCEKDKKILIEILGEDQKAEQFRENLRDELGMSFLFIAPVVAAVVALSILSKQ